MSLVHELRLTMLEKMFIGCSSSNLSVSDESCVRTTLNYVSNYLLTTLALILV